MKKRYLAPSNEAPRVPLGTAAFWYMFIQYFELPEWTLGVWGLMVLLVTIAALHKLFTFEKVEL